MEPGMSNGRGLVGEERRVIEMMEQHKGGPLLVLIARMVNDVSASWTLAGDGTCYGSTHTFSKSVIKVLSAPPDC